LIVSPSHKQTSEEWLRSHSLEYHELTLKDLLLKGKQAKKNSKEKHLVFKAIDVAEKEYKLNNCIESYHKRIKWLLQGSRKHFGLVTGENVAVLIDSSDDNIGFGRISEFQQSLLNLLDEQLQHKKLFYFLSVGTDPHELWESMRTVNTRRLIEAKDYIKGLHPLGGCNLLGALKKTFKLDLSQLDSIVVILGTCCNQTTSPLFQFIEEVLVDRHIPIQTIAFNTTNNLTHNILRRISHISKGRFHCYSTSNKKQVYQSFDIKELLNEAQKAVDVLNKIRQMRTGLLGDALVSIESEISLEVERLAESRFLPRPLNHHRPLSIKIPKFNPITSDDWLSRHGLHAKNLNLYQILAPNAFDQSEKFVPILGKSVQSTILKDAMHQVKWEDGTTKNIHVDVAMIYQYQTLLGSEVRGYEKRIEWLSSESRKIWGTICEKRIILLVDTSNTNKQFIIHIQHSLRLCLEEQIANKEAFNIIAFGSHPKPWKPFMIKPTPESLQEAWSWILELQAGGSRNFLSAFRTAIENDDDIKGLGSPDGIYLITSGIQNQEENVVCSFISECCIGINFKLHTILFNIEGSEIPDSDLPSRYSTADESADYLRNLSRAANGRFHWFNEKGIIESDDIYLISREMTDAVNYSKQCSTLVQAVRDKDHYRKDLKQLMVENGKENRKNDESNKIEFIKPFEFIEPKHTALTMARLKMKEENNTCLKNIWKVSDKKASLPEEPYKSKKSFLKSPKRRVGKIQKEQFYLDQQSNNVATIYRKFPKTSNVRKSIPEPIFPSQEERITSKEWLRKYGLKKIKLNLNKYIHGALCRHNKLKVNLNGRKSLVTSKWFDSLFPSAHIDGAMRHIDMKEEELLKYEEQVTRTINRYTSRMKWLLSGSRKTFGTIIESRVIILIDISGSMTNHIEELQRELTLLLWQQLRKHEIKFNLVAFSNEIKPWQDALMKASDQSCEDASQWISALHPHGGTATLEALRFAISNENIQAVYLISDGKPDTSSRLTLEKVSENNHRKIPIHCISFKCENSSANQFLQKLAVSTGGRYHSCYGDDDAQLAIHRLVNENQCTDQDDPNLPRFPGDDLELLRKEIDQSRRFLSQSRDLREIIRKYNEEKTQAKTSGNENKSSQRPFYP